MKNLFHPHRAYLAFICLTGLPTWSLAGLADIANVPLASAAATPKPNIMFILDDSGSMGSEYMPDDMSGWDRYGYYSSQCNGLWFNPNNNYEPPISVASNGTVTSYPNASFSAAWVDGYNQSAGTTNLDNWGYYQYTGTQPAMNWTYNANGTRANSTFITECRTNYNNAGPFNWVSVTTASSAALKQNYANWYSYYRSRLLTMRTAAGRAFKELDSNYRIGFTMISDDSVAGSDFLNIADFNNTQKYDFFNKLYTSYSGSWTPLRGALAKTGQYYGNVASGQTSDPVQYSCQRNYAILSTDGYWNDNIETSSYGPYKLDRSTEVGQQDGAEARPMKDGASSTRVVRWDDPFETTITTRDSITTTYSGTQYDVAASTGTGGCSDTRYLVQSRPASCAVTWDRTSVNTVRETDWYETRTVNGATVAGYPTSGTSRETITDTTTPASRPSCPTANWTATGAWTSSCTRQRSLPLSEGTTGYVASRTVVDAVSSSTPTTTTNDPPRVESDTTVATGGSSNSLADVAEYYYVTDLRPELANTLKATGADTATHQHLTTYTLGLGVKGTLSYDVNYLNTPATGDYAALISGTKDWPTPSKLTGGSENATHIDDLWHAAVNGRGRYFSASDPAALSNALATTLGEIQARNGRSAAAASSSLKPTDADGWIFLPTYVTQSNTSSWHGDLRAYKRRFVNNKAVAPDTSDGSELWSARNLLESRSTARRIFFGSSGTLAEFTYTNLTAASLNGHFDNRCPSTGPQLSQCGSITATAKAKVTGANIVNYLRGDKSLYLNTTAVDDRVFRSRAYRLGDIVNSAPVFVGKPPFRYADTGYANFATSNASRSQTVYIGGNDGMLHAFKVGLSVDANNNPVVASDAGTELWAFIPSAVIPDLWRLADDAFDDNHRYYVDATPVVGDIYDSTASRWRTILVGGLGAGGKSYYALDITDPVNPSLLWEFSDSNLGLSYGNPIITKNAAGTWVVMFSSGINNNAGDGKGRLFIRNAVTGAAENGGSIATTAGSSATPSNLVRIDAWVDAETNNTAKRVYGGDMEGNLWRFDYDDLIAPSGREATLLGVAQTSGAIRQPISAKPLLSEISVGGTRHPVISIGTGRYLGASDLTDTTTQSIYSVKDTMTSTGHGVLRSNGAALVEQTMNSAHKVTTVNTVDWSTKNGWYIDLSQSSKERIAVDPVNLTPTRIAFSSIIPGVDLCVPGGTSYLYEFDLLTGNIAGATAFNSLIVGLGVIENRDGTLSVDRSLNDARGVDTACVTDCEDKKTGIRAARRSSWRELID